MPKVSLKRKFPNARHREPEYLGHGLYRYPSRTEPDKSYGVDVSGCFDFPLRAPSCQCKGFEVRSWCQHIEDAATEHLRLLFAPKPEARPPADEGRVMTAET